MLRYRLARPEDRLPMPGRGPGVYFTPDPAGESINPLDPFYARMIADGDLVAVPTEEQAPPAVSPARAKKGD